MSEDGGQHGTELTAYLRARLAVVEQRVRRALAERRRRDPGADANPYRGWYVAEQTVTRLLGRPPVLAPGTDEHAAAIAQGLAAAEVVARTAETAGVAVPLVSLISVFSLTELDAELLLTAVAPEVDHRFGIFYGYLHDDVDRPHASVALALELCGMTAADPSGRCRLVPGAPLLASGLLTVTDQGQPFPARTLRVDDRVAGYLLGDDRIDPALTGFVRQLSSPGLPADSQAREVAERLAGCLTSGTAGSRLAYLRGTPDSAVIDVAVTAAALTAPGRGPGGALFVDLTRLPAGHDPLLVLASAGREARLREHGLVIGPVDRLPPDPAERALVLRALPDTSVPVVLFGPAAWDARWSDDAPLLAAVGTAGKDERDRWWRTAIGHRPDGPAGAAEVLGVYRLAPHQVRGTVDAAWTQAAAEQRPVTTDDLLRSARRHNTADLERLARRVEPSATWEDLVLAPTPTEQLRELAGRHRYRDTVLADWRLRPAHGSASRVTALFTGESGTGKTLAAEVLAASAGLDLYVVNLATVVDKYIGETEKNLERIFTAAAGAQGMLFFDEADALFGKRSKVSDAHDRFANIETAYLLQRMETFGGLAILATNLSGNVDQAFLRRLDAVIHFPRPAAAERTRLWDLCLGLSVPRAQGLDLASVAAAFDLTGGSIRSAALTAAYQAAGTGRPVSTADLYAAVRTEYRKLGRVIDETEFAGANGVAASPGRISSR
jgi:winged helix domain-containing protein/ATPase family protein associated with various cellular activities (AAA)